MQVSKTTTTILLKFASLLVVSCLEFIINAIIFLLREQRNDWPKNIERFSSIAFASAFAFAALLAATAMCARVAFVRLQQIEFSVFCVALTLLLTFDCIASQHKTSEFLFKPSIAAMCARAQRDAPNSSKRYVSATQATIATNEHLLGLSNEPVAIVELIRSRISA